MAVRVNPTFLLKGVNPQQIMADYAAGLFNRGTHNKSKIPIAKSNIILAPTYGKTNRDPVFCVKDRNNSNVIIATTSHADFQVFNNTGGKLAAGGRCEWCHSDFADTHIGYPIAFQETNVLVSDGGANSQNHRNKVMYTFWVEGRFDSFECMLAYVKKMLSRPSNYRESTMRDCERWGRLMYRLTYPSAGALRPAQDPRLLALNGGSLTYDEWNDGRHIYARTDRVLMIPAKVEYVMQNFNNTAVPIELTRETA